MPSQRFLKLPEEKKRAIWEAATAEFIRQPYDKVSINRIIKDAGISRGSFYTYFEDKSDLQAFILEDTKNKWARSCLEGLEKSDGDFFGMMELFMDYGIRFCRDNNLLLLHRNLIMYQEGQLLELSTEAGGCKEEYLKELMRRIDTSRFRDKTESGCWTLLKISMAAMLMGLSDICLKPEREEEVRREFARTMKLLCAGAYTNPENNQTEE